MKRQNIFKITLIALFIAIIFVMDFTPIGYITTGYFSITLMTLPVAIGAVCTGIEGGVILGAVFGLTSFLQCFGIGYFIDPSGAALFNISPTRTVILCFIPRILAGFLTALIFHVITKYTRKDFIPISVSCAAMPVMNTIFFLTSFYYLFRSTYLKSTPIKDVLMTAISLNGLFEFSITLIAGTVICKVVYKYVGHLKNR